MAHLSLEPCCSGSGSYLYTAVSLFIHGLLCRGFDCFCWNASFTSRWEFLINMLKATVRKRNWMMCTSRGCCINGGMGRIQSVLYHGTSKPSTHFYASLDHHQCCWVVSINRLFLKEEVFCNFFLKEFSCKETGICRTGQFKFETHVKENWMIDSIDSMNEYCVFCANIFFMQRDQY